MAKLRNISNNSKKNNGIISLKTAMEKLQKRLSIGKKSYSKFSIFNNDHLEDLGDSTYVPKDVKEGHFAVLAVDDDEPRRFVVPLQYLTHPTFLRLLEEAAEEYGFDHGGAVAIPCRPCELEGILAEQWHEERDSYSNMVQSC